MLGPVKHSANLDRFRILIHLRQIDAIAFLISKDIKLQKVLMQLIEH